MNQKIGAFANRLSNSMLSFILKGRWKINYGAHQKVLLNSAVRETIMSSTSYRCSFLCYRNNILVVLIPSTKLNPNMGKHGKVFHDKFYRFYKFSYLFPRTSVASFFFFFSICSTSFCHSKISCRDFQQFFLKIILLTRCSSHNDFVLRLA